MNIGALYFIIGLLNYLKIWDSDGPGFSPLQGGTEI